MTNGATFMLRCCQLGLSFDDLKHYTVGMIYDMLIEKVNDSEDYPVKGTQDDLRRILG